jgi:NADPH:quinone reductase-like Zn-dependent oxidoreductase
MATIPTRMAAVHLTGHGGFDKLVYRDDVPVPVPRRGEVLIRVGAAGVNNTDINTRIGWYSRSVNEGTTSESGQSGIAASKAEDSSWFGGAISFPRIQGIDACGRIVALGDGIDPARLGERVLVESCLREPVGWAPFQAWYLGSECDGGFAQYLKVPAVHAHRIQSELSDAELGSFPCAYSTAENMLTRTGVAANETVLVTGASGGVGSAAVQLARRRGARVIAVAGAAKHDALRELGAAAIVTRGADLVAALGAASVDVVVDVAAGPQWPQLIEVMNPGGRYAVSGAIAGPMVELDIRRLYLKDLTLFGCTCLEPGVFANLVRYIEAGDIKPLIARTFPLSEIVAAQRMFLAKQIVGKIVLIPPE